MKVSNKGSNPMMNTPGADAAKAGRIGTDSAAAMKKSEARSGAAASGLAGSAKVELSSRAQDIKKAKELATPNDGIDEAKVARLQALIDKGEYKVDAKAVADRLVDEHLIMPD